VRTLIPVSFAASLIFSFILFTCLTFTIDYYAE
jgi:hypothetical protein